MEEGSGKNRDSPLQRKRQASKVLQLYGNTTHLKRIEGHRKDNRPGTNFFF